MLRKLLKHKGMVQSLELLLLMVIMVLAVSIGGLYMVESINSEFKDSGDNIKHVVKTQKIYKKQLEKPVNNEVLVP